MVEEEGLPASEGPFSPEEAVEEPSPEELAEATIKVQSLLRKRMVVPERLILAEEGKEHTSLEGSLVPTAGSLCPYRAFLTECGDPEANCACCRTPGPDYAWQCARYVSDEEFIAPGLRMVTCSPEVNETQEGKESP